MPKPRRSRTFARIRDIRGKYNSRPTRLTVSLILLLHRWMKHSAGGRPRTIFLIGILFLSYAVSRSDAAVALTPLGRFLTARGYGGAQFVQHDNFFRLPINSNGKAGDLIIDTGASTSLIFRGSLGKLGLTEEPTKEAVKGAFGAGREMLGLTKIGSFTMGNCTVQNLPVAIASDHEGSGIFRRYGSSDGLFGLREMVKFGAVLDLGNRLLFIQPSGPSKEIAAATRSMLTAQGYAAVQLTVHRSHLRVPGAINGWPCTFIVDSGAYVTSIDRESASKARIGGARTYASARGMGKSGGTVSVATFPGLRIGTYEIKRASAAVMNLNADILGRGTDSEAAGFLGAEYLGMNSAIFDFNSLTLFLKPKSKS
jgi:predicted aspartyl protease